MTNNNIILTSKKKLSNHINYQFRTKKLDKARTYETMVFGEIVEPSTRALIDEDLEEYPEYTESVPQWEGNAEAPEDIEMLFFIETERVKNIFLNCVLENQKPFTKILNAGIEIFKIDESKYVVIFSQNKEFTCGEITELLDNWIRKAKERIAITSDSIYNYQNSNLRERPVSLIRTLSSSKSKTFDFDRLESPNLVTGLGASVLTYCVHTGLQCDLFVVYVDTSPADSLNMGPLLNLVKKLGIPLKNTEIKMSISSSNLYM